jgi:hypothetical protein
MNNKIAGFFPIAAVFFAIFSSQGSAMSFFGKKEEIVVASPMEGAITYKGEPVKNARVERWLSWENEEGETDFVYTDSNGIFNLPLVKGTVRIRPLGSFVIAQEISVHFEGEKKLIWYKAKRDLGLFGELGGVPKNLRCDLSDEPKRVEQGEGLLGTSCKWDSIDKDF